MPVVDGQSAVRAFAAIPLAPELLLAVKRVQDELQSKAGPGLVRWTAEHQLHSTLRFYGNVRVDQLNEISAALGRACEGIDSFKLILAGLGCFPTLRKPSVIWLGLKGDVALLERLHKRVEEETGRFGSHGEDRAFHPHLTIGRCKAFGAQARALGEALGTVPQNLTLGSWTVGQLQLIQSRLSPGGSIYTLLGQWPLG
jgi:RNA 2',3'-cyclic 3'-phosphodiesterase